MTPAPDVYGNEIKLSDGALDDPEANRIARRNLLDNYRNTVATLGKPLTEPEIIEYRHQPNHSVSRKQMEEWGWSAEEITETLAWQESANWPTHNDRIIWRARTLTQGD